MSIANSIGKQINTLTTLNPSEVLQDAGNSLSNKAAFFTEYIINYTAMITQSALQEKVYDGIESLMNNQLKGLDIPVKARLIMFRAKDINTQDMTFPFLILPVNPNTFTVKFKKKSDLVYTLGGFVINHWHEDFITITAEGTLPSFQNKSKIFSTSYYAFLSLLNMYKTGGELKLIPQTIPVSRSKDTNDLLLTAPPVAPLTASGNTAQTAASNAEVLAGTSESNKDLRVKLTELRNATIELQYQNDIYEGIFKSLEIKENYEQPNTISYTIEFHAISKKDILFGSLDEDTFGVQPTSSISPGQKGQF